MLQDTAPDELPPNFGQYVSSEAPLTEQELNSVIEEVREVSSLPSSADPLIDLGLLDGDLDGNEYHEAAYYWDMSTMGRLNDTSLAAIARLRTYQPPPFPLWDRLPVNRRAAVLILLYADRVGHLRVVITMRAASLRSFSGQAAFPGGKADTVDETPYQIARREAWEEIGLPMDDAKIPSPFSIEQLCYLPHSLARTGVVVRPCVAFLHPDPSRSKGAPPSDEQTPTVDESLIPRLDAKEVAAVFSAPFHNFLRAKDEVLTQPPAAEAAAAMVNGDGGGGGGGSNSSTRGYFPPGVWYEGRWTEYNGFRWRLHYFHVPVNRQQVTRPRVRTSGAAALEENDEDEMGSEKAPARFKVWGMTGRILVECASIAFGEEPEFEHDPVFGDEEMITKYSRQIVEGIKL